MEKGRNNSALVKGKEGKLAKFTKVEGVRVLFSNKLKCVLFGDEVDGPTLQVEQVKVPLDPMTRVSAKRLNEALQVLIKAIQEEVGVPETIEGLDNVELVNLIKVDDVLDP